MIPTALSRLVIASAALVAVAAIAPAHATSDWQSGQSAPGWLDQTVYRPGCPAQDTDRDCAVEHSCSPICLRW
jgi:hypothetical protein